MDSVPPDQDRGPQMLAIVWVLSSASTIMVALRCYARYIIRGLGWDDWTMVMAAALFTIGNVFFSYLMHCGGGRHVHHLSRQQISQAAKWLHIARVPILLLYAAARISVGLLTLRVIGRSSFWRKWILVFVMASSTLINMLTFILSFAQCTPSRAIWDHSISGATCWPDDVMTRVDYFMISWNCFCDVALALLPVTFIYKLHINAAKKRVLTAVLSLGLLAAVCCGIKIKFQHELQRQVDFTWLSYDIEMWSAAEAFLLIFCGCMPALMPLWDRFISKRLDVWSDQVPLRPPPGNRGMRQPNRCVGLDTTHGPCGSTDIEDSALEHGQKRIHVTNSFHVNHDSPSKV